MRIINKNVQKVKGKKPVNVSGLVAKNKLKNSVQNNPNILHSKVISNNLSEVWYNKKTHVMLITFNTGRSYSYFGVSLMRYEKLIIAPSKGSYFVSNIKGKYRFKEM